MQEGKFIAFRPRKVMRLEQKNKKKIIFVLQFVG